MRTQATVVGEALIDIVVAAGGGSLEHIGGSPANVAIGLARLGHETCLATHVGADEHGRRIEAALAAEGVRLLPGSMSATHTPTATARLDRHGAASYDFDLQWEVDEAMRVDPGAHLHTGSIAATLQPGADAVRRIVEANRGHSTVSYDPNARPTMMGDADKTRRVVEGLVALSDVVKASDEDIAWLYHGADPETVLRAWLALGPQLAVATCGADGALVAMGGQVRRLPSPTVTVVDTVGAGDSFMSGLISGLLDADLLGGIGQRARWSEASWETVRLAVHRALACAAVTVGRAGADPPHRLELPPG